MEPDGMVNACTTNARMRRARSTATTIASPYSRTSDLRRGLAAVSAGRGGGLGPGLDLAHPRQLLRTDRNASCGTSTFPTCFMRFLPSFCFSRSFRFRVMSPP